MRKLNILALLLLCIACHQGPRKPVLSPQQQLLQSFNQASGFGAWLVDDTSLVKRARGWQGSGSYPGVDNWFAVRIVPHKEVFGGLPGQSAFYSIGQTLQKSDTVKVTYWKMLQVQENPKFGYRPKVGDFEIMDTINAAISIVHANPQFGGGGAWQLYIEGYDTVLHIKDDIDLK